MFGVLGQPWKTWIQFSSSIADAFYSMYVQSVSQFARFGLRTERWVFCSSLCVFNERECVCVAVGKKKKKENTKIDSSQIPGKKIKVN